ncbi:DUF5304 family protein [Streptomyces sp. NPDC007088]|uniref:DUF5304 family protein n=1 Tax=Streptomyces sp. NPDC007088 TaxID=3364773 RepID=UPI0036B392D2
MSEATEPSASFDDDAWSTACAEDLAAERARRRQEQGPRPGSAAEELRRLAEAVADRVGAFSALAGSASPVAGATAEQVVRQVVQQAKSVVEPVLERNPQVFDHLAAAGAELLAAYRSAVSGQESRWTRGDQPSASGGATPTGTAGQHPGKGPGQDGTDGPSGPGRDEEGPGRGEHIDLD